MSEDIAVLGIGIDSTPVERAVRSLDDLAASAKRTEQSTEALSRSAAQSNQRYKEVAQAAIQRRDALDAEVRSSVKMAQETRKVTAEMQGQAREYTRIASAELKAQQAKEKSTRAMQQQARAAELNRQSLQKLLNQIDPLTGKLDRLDDMEMKLHATFKQGAVDAETYATALAKISAQRDTISGKQFDQVAKGAEGASRSIKKLGLNSAEAQRSLITLGNAARSGNWGYASTSIGTLARSTGLMSAAMSVAGLAVGGVVAAVGALAVAYHKGSQEAVEYNKALVMTGNYAGTTSSQMAGMAQRIGQITGTTGQAARALADIARTGRIAGDAMEMVGEAAIKMERATGKAVSDTVAEFVRLGEAPSEATAKLNEQYNYLTGSVYEQIRALEEQGRTDEAAALAQKTYADAFINRADDVVQNVGYMEQAWASLKGTVLGAWDAMKGVGRESSAGDNIVGLRDVVADIEKQIGERLELNKRDPNDRMRAMGSASVTSATLPELQRRLSIAQEILRVAEGTAINEAATAKWIKESADAARQRIDDSKHAESYLNSYKGKTLSGQLEAEDKAFKQALAGVKEGTKEYEEVLKAHAANVEAINKSFEKKGSGAAAAHERVTASLRARLAEEKALAAELSSRGTQQSALNQYERMAAQMAEQLQGSVSGQARANLELNKSLAEQVGAQIRANEATKDFANERNKYYESVEKGIEKTRDEAKAIQDKIKTFGMSKRAMTDLAIADLRMQKVALQSIDGNEQVNESIREQIELIERQIAAYQELGEAQGGLERVELAKKANDEMARDWQKTVDEYGRVFRDGFAGMLNKGKDGWKSFTRSLKTTFQTTVADQIYKMLAQPFVVKIVASMAGITGMGGLAQAGSALSNAGGAASATSSLGGLSLLTNFGGSVAGSVTDLGGWLASSSSQAISDAGANLIMSADSIGAFADVAGDVFGYGTAILSAVKGNWGAAAGSAIGTYFGGPIGSFIGSTIGGYIDKSFGGETRHGGVYNWTRGEESVARDSGWSRGDPGAEANTAISGIVESARVAIDAAFEGVGSAASLGYFMGWAESSEKGRGGTASGGWLDLPGGGVDFGTYKKGEGHGSRSGDLGEMVDWLAVDVQQTIIQAWQAGIDEFPALIQDMIRGIDADALSGEQAGAVVQSVLGTIDQVNALTTAFDSLPFENLKALTFDATAALMRFGGGVDAFTTNLNTYFQNFYSQEEQLEFAAKQMAAAFEGIGREMPDVTSGADQAKAAFREMVESIDVTTEAGQRSHATMITLAGDFAQLAVGMEGLNAAVGGSVNALQAAFDQIEQLSTNLQRTLQAKLSSGELADQIGKMLGQAPVYAPRREAELWAEINRIGSMSTAQQYLNANPDLALTYRQHGAGQTAEGFATRHYEQYGRSEGRTFGPDWAKQAEMARELTDLTLTRIAMEQDSEREKQQAIQDQITSFARMRDLAVSLRNYLRSLESSALAPYSLREKVGIAEADLAGLVTAARDGDDTALSQVQGSLQNALTLWRSYGASGSEYQAAYHRLTGMVGNLANSAISEAEQQIRQLEAQSFALDGISDYTAAQLLQLEALHDLSIEAAEALDVQYKNELAAMKNQIVLLEGIDLNTQSLHDIAALLADLPAQIATNLASLIPDMSPDGSHASGLRRVPYDGYLAELHQGERVLTAFEAQHYDVSRSVAQPNGTALIGEIRMLRQEVAQLRSQNEALGRAQVDATVNSARTSADRIVGGVGDSLERRGRDDVSAGKSVRKGVLA